MFSRLFKSVLRSRNSQVSSPVAKASRLLRIEPLERRELLSVSTPLIAPENVQTSEYISNATPDAAPIPLGALENPQTTVIDASSASLDVPVYPLDVNFKLDGKLLYDQGVVDIKEGAIGSFDVYINDELYAENVGDFFEEFLPGTKFEIKNVSLNPGYEFIDVSSQTSWKNYGVAAGALSGTIQEVAAGPNEVLLSLATVSKYPLDVNFTLDGQLLYDQGVVDIKEGNIGSFDVYINDELYAENVGDFYGEFFPGTKFEIKNLSLDPGYEFINVSSKTSWKNYGVAAGALSGTIQKVSKGPNEVLLSLATASKYPLDVNFTLDGQLLYDQGVVDVKEGNIGSFDVYINDELYAENVGDFYDEFLPGTKFEIKNLKLNPEYEFINVSSKTSWKNYGVAAGALSGTVQEVSKGPNEVLVSLATASKYPLDVNFTLDGQLIYNLDVVDIKEGNIGSFDVYINGELYAENVGDFYEKFLPGTTFEIKNLKLNPGYEFVDVSSQTSWKNYGVAAGALSGTIQEVAKGPNEVLLRLSSFPGLAFSIETGGLVADRELELYAPIGYSVYYTTDGSDPTISSENLYSEPLQLTANASRFAADSDLINIGPYKIYDDASLPTAITIKAIAVGPDGATSPIATRTYFFQEREPIAVISISTDYDNLLDYDTGIMVKGAYYDAWVNTPEAATIIANYEFWNFQGNYTQKGKDWERPATIEIFDGDNYLIENCGIRLRGGASRMYSQKSFNVYFKKDYGVKELNYALFDDAESLDGNVLSSYKNFMLRNGGNDTECLKFHDALIQSLVKDLDLTTQANRPAVLYLNGEYMGLFIMQEKYSDSFFADHYGVAKNNVVVVEEGVVEEGKDEDIALYEELQAYANMDLSNPEIYNAFCNVVDIESMIDYYAVQIYIGNADWGPEKNASLWRVRTPENDSFGDGKWRWVLYDTDFSAALYKSKKTSHNYNSFAEALEVDPLFASVLKNDEFYQSFVDKIRSLGEDNFSTTNVQSALNSFSEVYAPYMPDFYKRFGDTSQEWNSNINGIKNFFANRLRYILNYVENYQP